MGNKELAIPKNIAVIVYTIVLIATMIIAVILHTQYRVFLQKTQKLILIKQSYSQHIEMLKRSLYVSLSDESSESNDEPEDIQSLQKNDSLTNEGLHVDLFTRSVGKKKNIEPLFDFISPEEESRLFSLKNMHSRINSDQILPKKKLLKRRKEVEPSYSSGKNCLVRVAFDFAWPIELAKFWLSSLYGPRRFANGKISFHHGIDMASVRGTIVKASASGKVICAQYVSGYGNCVDVYHNKHYKTRYAHLYTIAVSVGQNVQIGQQIGTVGDTGHVRKSGKDGSHLHFEIHQDGHSVNPLKFLFL